MLRSPPIIPQSPIEATVVWPDPPLAHYNYDEIDVFCKCSLCAAYFQATEDFAFHKSLTHGHEWQCKCYICRQRRSVHLESLSAGSRRDLYSELSYLTHGHPYGPQFMTWTLQRIRDPRYKSEAWWATHSPKKPLNAWMHEWQKANLTREMIAASGLF